MPTVLVRSALKDIPLLQSEEAVESANCVAFGSGRLSEEGARSVSQRWADAQRRPGDRQSTPRPTALMAHGIPIRRVKTVKKPTV